MTVSLRAGLNRHQGAAFVAFHVAEFFAAQPFGTFPSTRSGANSALPEAEVSESNLPFTGYPFPSPPHEN